MLPENIKAFVAETNRGVLTTFRRDGAAQMSIITCGPYKDGVAFTTTAKRAKLLNLQRDSRCSLLISNENWWGFVVLEGRAQIISAANTIQAMSTTAGRTQKEIPMVGRRNVTNVRTSPGLGRDDESDCG